MLLGYGLTWTGARIFDGRPIRPLLVLLAPLAWLLLCRIPVFADSVAARIIVGSAMLALLDAACGARSSGAAAASRLMSRWPMIIVLLAMPRSCWCACRRCLLSSTFGGDFVLSKLSFTLLAFGTLLFTVVLAFLQLNMTKERTELKHKINSLVDPLSGVANRRAFLDGAAALLARQETDHEPLAVLLFDLDHFKQINDQFGHALGDTVLQTFAGDGDARRSAPTSCSPASAARNSPRCLPVGDIDEAYAIADRVRRNFAAVAARFGIGTLLAERQRRRHAWRAIRKQRVTELLSIVDRALYRAKELGRNRVELEMPSRPKRNAASPSIVPIIGPDRAASGRNPPAGAGASRPESAPAVSRRRQPLRTWQRGCLQFSKVF